MLNIFSSSAGIQNQRLFLRSVEIVITHNMRVNIGAIKENVLENNITAQTERQMHLHSPPFTNDLAQQSLRWTVPVAHPNNN